MTSSMKLRHSKDLILASRIAHRRSLAVPAYQPDQFEEDEYSPPSTSYLPSSYSSPTTASTRPTPRFPRLEFPAPALRSAPPPNSSNKLKITSRIPLSSLALTLAIVKAVEDHCDNKVLDINQPKLRDFSGKNGDLYLTLLYPVALASSNSLNEIFVPLPSSLIPLTNSRISRDPRTASGGPGIRDLEAAMFPPSSSISGIGTKIQGFKVEVTLCQAVSFPLEAPEPTKRMPIKRGAEISNSGLKHRWIEGRKIPIEDLPDYYANERIQRIAEEESIVETLGKWKGRYGGFEHLNKIYEGYKSPATSREEVEMVERAELEQKDRERLLKLRQEQTREEEELMAEERAKRRERGEMAAPSETTTLGSSSLKDGKTSSASSTTNESQHPSSPRIPRILPSEKRLLRRKYPSPAPVSITPESTESTTGSSSSSPAASLQLKSQQGRIEELRQEAWAKKTENAQKVNGRVGSGAKGGDGWFGGVTDFLKNGIGGGEKK